MAASALSFILVLGEEEEEPEVDLSSFLAHQRLDDGDSPSKLDLLVKNTEDDSDVDESLLHILPKSSEPSRSHKGKIQTIEWDEGLEEIRREKEIADANRGELLLIRSAIMAVYKTSQSSRTASR